MITDDVDRDIYISKVRLDYIFSLFIISIFIDYSFFGVTITHLIMSYFIIFYFFNKKIDNEIILISIFLLPYLIVSLYLNSTAYIINVDRMQYSELRPALLFINMLLELLFLSILLRERVNLNITRNYFSYFIIILLALFLLNILTSSFLNNESGIYASNIILVIYILYFKTKYYFIKSIPSLVTLLITKSSTIIILPFFLFKYFRKYFLLFIAATIIFLYLIPNQLFISNSFGKIETLYNPSLSDNFGGRYWANIIYLEMLSSYNILFGVGLDSFNYFRGNYYPTQYITFDHGGSDILKVLSSFGIVGSIIFLTILIKLCIKYNIQIDIWGSVIVFLLMVKGLGLFSSIGTLTLYLLASTKFRYSEK